MGCQSPSAAPLQQRGNPRAGSGGTCYAAWALPMASRLLCWLLPRPLWLSVLSCVLSLPARAQVWALCLLGVRRRPRPPPLLLFLWNSRCQMQSPLHPSPWMSRCLVWLWSTWRMWPLP